MFLPKHAMLAGNKPIFARLMFYFALETMAQAGAAATSELHPGDFVTDVVLRNASARLPCRALACWHRLAPGLAKIVENADSAVFITTASGGHQRGIAFA
jgi:hypothetical protein